MAKADKKEVKPDGSLERPFPWVAPFPASVLKDVKVDGVVKPQETVFVKGVLTQDVIMNGVKMAAGPQVMGAGFAHQHSAVIDGPKE